jgi:signal transduction histidine kinase
MLLISLIILIVGLLNQGLSINELITQYSTVVVLVILAWIISRVLFGTRVKSFHGTKTLENARNNLDRSVKERTSELRETNVKLKDEINERKRYEVFLEIEKRKAEEADRLKSVFLANMSHEIRTPLNGLLGFSDLLQNTEIPEEKKSRYLEIIQNNGQQLLKIIDDIMDISMIESNQLKVNLVNFRVSQILPDALAYFSNLKQTLNKQQIDIVNLGFEENVSDVVNSDPSRIQQVLYNLLNNALKFTTGGSIKFGGRNDDGYIMLYVEDTGIGLDINLCDTIFERFRQGEESISRAYGGTGLGLSISKGIVELLGGIIWVDFAFTQGARFCFTIPSEEIQKENKIPINKESLNILTEKEVIVSDNDPQSNTSLTFFLRCNKSNALCVKPGNFSVKELTYEPALIVLDIRKDPDLILTLTNEISKHLSRTKVIAICDDAEKHSNKLFEAGCSAVLRNPLNYHVFLLHLKRLIG